MTRFNKTKNKVFLLVSVGAPGSGKSYFAERLCKEYSMAHLRSDEIRSYIFPNPTYTATENGRLFELIDFLVDKFIALGVSVFYDANFTKRAFREKLRRVAKKHKASYSVVWVKTPINLAIERAKKRKFHPVGEAVVRGIHNEIELPKNEPVISIDGTLPYNKQKLEFKKLLS